jgi:hypothetical protein
MKQRLIIVLLILLCQLLPNVAHAQNEAPDLPTYTNWVRETLVAVQRRDRIGAEESARQLVATTSVRLDANTTISTNNTWLQEALAKTDPDFPALEQRLGAILDALALPNSAVPADARQKLEELLNAPPFGQRPPAEMSWWDRMWDDFFRWLGRILDSIFYPINDASVGAGPSLGWLIGIVGGILLLAVFAYLLFGLRRNLAAAAQKTDDPEANLTSRTAFDQANDVARSGDYRSAMRYLYLAALLWLDEKGKLRYDRALTNREYLSQLRDDPKLRERLAPVVDTFDRVWYGHAPLDDTTFAVYQRQVEDLRKES